MPRTTGLTRLAARGFIGLSDAASELDELAALLRLSIDEAVEGAQFAADPDGALRELVLIARRDSTAVRTALQQQAEHVWRLFGASQGLARFALRHPQEILRIEEVLELPHHDEMRARFLEAVADNDGFSDMDSEEASIALRIAYRRELARIALFDLGHPEARGVVDLVARALADAAGAALDAALSIARAQASDRQYSRHDVAHTRLAIIGMGKAGAGELNYVSDVDVIFVSGTSDDTIVSEVRALQIATTLAQRTISALAAPDVEPPLWEVDTNLRPEGAKGTLVRSLSSHVAYYEKWAESWEFQALLKARPLAGDWLLGEEYTAAVAPKIWSSAARTNFVASVQRMRERVTENIPDEERNYQLKLGPGGLRDIEFTVQLLQLVHGVSDDRVRQASTLDALDALVAGGYVGRAEGSAFAQDYRTLRILEHRLQLAQLQRTHLMPSDSAELSVLARSTGLAGDGSGLWLLWERIKREVREIHVRLFYRPLLTAVAQLGEDERALTTEQAHDRLVASGFTDPAGALRHVAALTSGLRRSATIQRTLLPVILLWLAEGSDPDYGLLVFRRLSDALGDSPWFLRMLRDSSGAAERLTRLVSRSRYIGELMEGFPESAAWLESEESLVSRPAAALFDEAVAVQDRADDIGAAMRTIRIIRRRELLRTAMAAVLDVQSLEDVARSLSDITDVTLRATLRAVRREVLQDDEQELLFAIVGMGRLGGRELGFGSDADVLFVYDANGLDPQRAQKAALRLVSALRAQSEDPRVPFELDADLRPEGRNGPLARSLDAYREYYSRWSVAWEMQALLRARPIAGDPELLEDMMRMTDEIRYPETLPADAAREIRRIKARVEKERLPQGVEPSRHVKLGPGGISDVEWLVQLLQLEHAHDHEALRTTSTVDALAALRELGMIDSSAHDRLLAAWRLASRIRSAMMLATGRASDVLPNDRTQLDSMARILGYGPQGATRLQEDWLRRSRRARRVFDRLFYA